MWRFDKSAHDKTFRKNKARKEQQNTVRRRFIEFNSLKLKTNFRESYQQKKRLENYYYDKFYKKNPAKLCFIQNLAGWTGLEPATFRVTGGRSIQAELPPHKLAPRAGFEPATQRLTVVCSTTELPRNTFQNYLFFSESPNCIKC